jgi:hypothetical protein
MVAISALIDHAANLDAVNPNQWGVVAGDPLSLCMNVRHVLSPIHQQTKIVVSELGSWLAKQVTTNNNETYATNITAPPFAATWQYPIGPETEPVHAFPNAKLDLPGLIPVQLSSMKGLNINTNWTYGVGDSRAASNDDATLSAENLNANVCVDMFVDADATSSQSTTTAAYEIMVWLGRWGTATLPIGWLEGERLILTVSDGTSFGLFFGANSLGQKVFTWVAHGNTTSFNADIYPLLGELSQFGGPAQTDHLGYVAFGSEALYSLQNVTFAVPGLEMDLMMA